MDRTTQRNRSTIKRANMKHSKTFLIMSAIAVALSFAAQANAGDNALLSPKARQLQDSLRRHPGEDVDMLDRSVKALSPKQFAMQQSLRRSPTREKDMIVRNAILGNARGRANSRTESPTWGSPRYLESAR